MLHLDLCCGLGGWQKPFRESGQWRSVGLDIRRDLAPDLQADVRQLPISADVTLLTASPPCTEFTRYMLPWLDEPNPDLQLVRAVLDAVDELHPRWWLMENSRGLHQYWREARRHVGAFYLWGDFPPFDVAPEWKGKMQTSGENPEQRAQIPYALADSVRQAAEVWA
jgi:hypothetical protein